MSLAFLHFPVPPRQTTMTLVWACLSVSSLVVVPEGVQVEFVIVLADLKFRLWISMPNYVSVSL